MSESSEDLISCVITPERSEGGEKHGKSWCRNGGALGRSVLYCSAPCTPGMPAQDSM